MADRSVGPGARVTGANLHVLTWGVDLCADDLQGSDVECLERLGGPTFIAVPGADPTRIRAVSTLLHGNEPSGLRAILRWLRSGARPATSCLFFIASVRTALTAPHFSHRHLPDRRDLNRCFDPEDAVDDAEGRLARAAITVLMTAEPELLVDIHNNTGHNPAYGVAVHMRGPELDLVSLFADRVVHAPIALGTIVEATVDHFPSVTVECGRSGDPAADEVAYQGLVTLLGEGDPMGLRQGRALAMLVDPIRVCVAPGISLAFGEDVDDPSAPGAEVAALMVSSDVDRHNFMRLSAGTTIGRVRDGTPWPLVAIATDGRECSREIFRIEDGRLVTTRAFTPVMMTTSPEIARSDCLFYAADEVDGESPDQSRSGP